MNIFRIGGCAHINCNAPFEPAEIENRKELFCRKTGDWRKAETDSLEIKHTGAPCVGGSRVCYSE